MLDVAVAELRVAELRGVVLDAAVAVLGAAVQRVTEPGFAEQLVAELAATEQLVPLPEEPRPVPSREAVGPEQEELQPAGQGDAR